MKHLILVAGARPNFMKIAPLVEAVRNFNRTHKNQLRYTLVHTGQHYDVMMSKIFFQELHIPDPDVYLGVGSGTHAEQTGKIMMAFEKVLRKNPCDCVVVVGDVNSTVACALTASKLHVPVAHVEAGLRSFDRSMPEEINRLLTDAISEFLFTPSPDADINLKNEGVPRKKIFLVGDIMIDSLLSHKQETEKRILASRLGLLDARNNPRPYALVTLHRPANVDSKPALKRVLSALKRLSHDIPVLFPMHPRTRESVKRFSLERMFTVNETLSPVRENGLYLMKPLGYLDFLHLMLKCALVITDSGGIQEETTYLKIPCLTLRTTTERPVTLTRGSNVLIPGNPAALLRHAGKFLKGAVKKYKTPKYWDGKTAERIIQILQRA